MSDSHSTRRVVVWVQQFLDRPNLVLQWHDPLTGKRKSKGAGTADPDEAETKRADLEYELNHGMHRTDARLTWERFRELFEAEYVAPLRENTRANYRVTLDLFERHCSPSRLDRVTTRTVSAFAAAMRTEKNGRGKDGMKASTVKVRLQFLHTALSWAAEQGLLSAVPKFPAVKVPATRPRPVPVESFERLLAKAGDDNMRAYLLCGWLAGLRLEEAYVLEWDETDEAPYVDADRDRIVLPAGFVKGSRDEWVPLDAVLKAALLALPRHGPRVFRFVDDRPGIRNGCVVNAGAVSDRVIALAKAAGVRLTMHTLRKGFGCRYAGKVPAQVLQKLMRHASIRTTMDYYANVDDAVMDAVLGPRRNDGRSGGTSAGQTPEAGGGATAEEEGTSGFEKRSR